MRLPQTWVIKSYISQCSRPLFVLASSNAFQNLLNCYKHFRKYSFQLRKVGIVISNRKSRIRQQNIFDWKSKAYDEACNCIKIRIKRVTAKTAATRSETIIQQQKTLTERKKKVCKFLDKYITKLLAAPTNDMNSSVTLSEVREVCLRCREQFNLEDALLRIDPPIYILGDLHGQFPDLVKIITKLGLPPRKRYLFMGDYVDRGQWGLETVSLLMAYKIRYPKAVYMLRGNHETRAVNRVYGFFEECTQRFPEENDGTQLWTLYQHTFNCMPFAAVIGGRIFATHGGISQDLITWNQFNRICRPTDITDIGFINDLIWADPGDFPGKYSESPRGVSQLFGKQGIDEFQQKLNIDLIVRAHQVVQDGYEFQHDKKCLTLFSAPCYCGEMENLAGILHVDQALHCTIYQFRGSRSIEQSKAGAPQNNEEKANVKNNDSAKKTVAKNGLQKSTQNKQEKVTQPKKKKGSESSNDKGQ